VVAILTPKFGSDFMGESTRDAAMAEQATREFLNVIQAITDRNLNASVSLDLSHIGTVIDAELGYENACTLAEAAQQAGLEMMISMEGTDRTDLILETHQRLCERFNNVGITLQTYLYRTRIYLPYGQEWHLYLCNRLAEYPSNLYQAIVDVVKLGYEQRSTV
jgi:proline dehydrogenase